MVIFWEFRLKTPVCQKGPVYPSDLEKKLLLKVRHLGLGVQKDWCITRAIGTLPSEASAVTLGNSIQFKAEETTSRESDL